MATVRPETMLADVAVAVNPDDDRYRALVGRTATLPLVGRELPIIADDYVKTDFGTGALKITPGHDPNDFEIGRRHGLPELSVVGEDGRMTEAAGDYAGLTAEEARERVVSRPRGPRPRPRPRALHPHRAVLAPLRERGSSRSSRSSGSCAWTRSPAPAAAAVRDGRVRIHPESQRGRYLAWLEDIRPWVLSRQLWWGHQLPVWYRARRDLRRARRLPRGTAGSATPTCSTRGSRAPCGRSRRSAGPTTRRSCAPSTRPTSSRRPATSSSCGSPAW